ncbi:MAG: HD-GYP domain-containing protein [Methylocystaceae bacterium]
MMRMKLSDLPLGAKLGHDVFSTNGQLLLAQGTSPTPYMIDRLDKLGISEVIVYDQVAPAKTKSTPARGDEPALLQSFKSAQQSMAKMADQILSDQPIEVPELDNNAQIINSEVLATNNIIKYLRQLHQANEYTLDHSVSVSVLSVKIAQCMGLNHQLLKPVTLAGLLHDIGKYRISSDILNKPGSLTKEETTEMQKHSVYGYRLIQSMGLGNQAIELAVLQHHEYVNGSGYPLGLSGDKISIIARIVAVADVFDALTSLRSYRSPVTWFKAAEEMRRSCFGQLDPRITRRFLHYLLNVSPGDQVFLSNGETARVIMFNFNNPNRPLVKTNSRFIDLEQEDEYDIVKVL